MILSTIRHIGKQGRSAFFSRSAVKSKAQNSAIGIEVQSINKNQFLFIKCLNGQLLKQTHIHGEIHLLHDAVETDIFHGVKFLFHHIKGLSKVIESHIIHHPPNHNFSQHEYVFHPYPYSAY